MDNQSVVSCEQKCVYVSAVPGILTGWAVSRFLTRNMEDSKTRSIVTKVLPIWLGSFFTSVFTIGTVSVLCENQTDKMYKLLDEKINMR